MPCRPTLALLASACALVAVTARDATAQPAPAAPTTRPALRDGFDPARHMHVSEVRDGMKGYGLTVFSGTKIERFDVEVISVLHNSFGPQADVVMIRCLDERMQHFGPIAGCSGSPIYLFDDSGKARLIGAYAFGFDFAKDPIVGVQPIENMLTLAKPPRGVDDTGTKPVVANYSLLEANVIPALAKHRAIRPLTSDDSSDQLRLHPLSVPLAIRGLSEESVAALRPLFRDAGFEPMLAPGASTTPSDGNSPKLEPGSVLGAAVMTGDVQLTALGTCTEVIDGRAYGFGHPFNGEGATSIPMGAGVVNLVMPTMTSSFKLGGISAATGAIDNDGAYGVAGQIGAVAATIPIHIDVHYAENERTRSFNYRAAVHRTFSAMMVGTALQGAVTAERELPVEHTAHYTVNLKFQGGRELNLENVTASLEGFDLSRDAAWPVATMMNNPFANVPIESVSASVEIERGVRAANIESASAAPSVYRPGETAKVLVRFRKHKGESFTRSFDVKLPQTLPDGDYSISIGDATSNLESLAEIESYRFVARNIDELFHTLQSVSGQQRSDRLFIRLNGIDEGLAIGHTALNKLPASRRALLQSAGRPDTAPAAGSMLTVVPMDLVVIGRVEVPIKIQRKLP